MSTGFFWDKGKKKFICERRGIGLGSNDYGKNLTYVFNSIEDVVKLLTSERERIIYNEYDVALTVDSLLFEIKTRGCIIIIPDYYISKVR